MERDPVEELETWVTVHHEPGAYQLHALRAFVRWACESCGGQLVPARRGFGRVCVPCRRRYYAQHAERSGDPTRGSMIACDELDEEEVAYQVEG